MSIAHLKAGENYLLPEQNTITREELFNRLEKDGIERKWYDHKVKRLDDLQKGAKSYVNVGIVCSILGMSIAKDTPTLIVGWAFGGALSFIEITFAAIHSVEKHLYLQKELNTEQISKEIEAIKERIEQQRRLYINKANVNLAELKNLNEQMSLIKA